MMIKSRRGGGGGARLLNKKEEVIDFYDQFDMSLGTWKPPFAFVQWHDLIHFVC
jgi:hypothetical protein